ncbi:MAG: hypothetical protein K2P85_07145 [Flavobacteriaceae bacterium]|nr:hypothetical protein [Flavobacteriaceae bacterium]
MSLDFAQFSLYSIKAKFMKEGYVIREQSLPHFLTVTVVDWVDVFSRKNHQDSVIECAFK